MICDAKDDRLDRLDLLLEFSAILQILRGITTSSELFVGNCVTNAVFMTLSLASPMMMAPQGRKQELLME